jgi:hypothetical protein
VTKTFCDRCGEEIKDQSGCIHLDRSSFRLVGDKQFDILCEACSQGLTTTVEMFLRENR